MSYQPKVYRKQGGDELVVASGGQITVESGGAIKSAVETVITTNVILASESGKTFFLDLAAGFTSTLPAPAAGLEYSFIVKTAPTGAAYVIATDGGANIIVITVNELETDTTEDGPSDDDADTVNLVENIALPGDRIDFKCDGTKWYAMGQTRADGAVTTSTT
jgi:hypothetical protein